MLVQVLYMYISDYEGNLQKKQDVREAYAYVFPDQECDLVTVLVCIMHNSNFTTEKIV